MSDPETAEHGTERPHVKIDRGEHQRIPDQHDIEMAANEQIGIVTSRRQIHNSSLSVEMLARHSGVFISHYDALKPMQSPEQQLSHLQRLTRRFPYWPKVENRQELSGISTQVALRIIQYEEHLKHAMADLDAVRAAAKEEGYPVPSKALVSKVGDLLSRVFDVAPRRYSVYPMEEGEIAIHASNEPTGAVVITCLPHDIWCVVSIGKSRRRAWFQSMDELPDPFMCKALEDLYEVAERP